MKSKSLLIALVCGISFAAQGQSTMEFQPGTTIEVTSGADICADSVAINGSFSGAGTQCGGALPVQLSSMTAAASARDITLRWTTATETGNFGFEVERRRVSGFMLHAPGYKTTTKQLEATWSKIGFVEGSGTSTSPKEYSFVDRSLPAGRYAYRIRQIDQTGTFTYTQAVEAEVGLAPRVFTLSQNYPNPFNPTTTIEFTLPEDGRVLVKIYDIAGRDIAVLADEERKAGVYHQVHFDASGIVSGTYFCSIEFGGKHLVRKMALIK